MLTCWLDHYNSSVLPTDTTLSHYVILSRSTLPTVIPSRSTLPTVILSRSTPPSVILSRSAAEAKNLVRRIEVFVPPKNEILQSI
jgi:hypothetical protein